MPVAADISPAVRFVQTHARFIITAHETPDGDAIGSEIACLRLLQSLGKDACIVNSDPTPAKFAFLDPEPAITVLSETTELPVDLAERVLLVLDTNDVYNTGTVAARILPLVADCFIIDHHESGQSPSQAVGVVDSEASSTCELVHHLFRSFDIAVDLASAVALYTGIVYDTGSFAFPKTTAKTFEIARALVLTGVSPNEIYGKVFESNSIPSLLLQSRVFATLRLHLRNRVAVQHMTKEMIAECGASYEEADTVINLPLRSKEIRVSVFIKENPQGVMRCSLRSKGTIDVSEIAQSFGGGGHKTAAGFKSQYPLEQTEAKVLEMLKVYFD